MADTKELSSPVVATSLRGLASEISTIGLNVSSGVILEDMYTDLTWPNSKATFAKMAYDPAIASANVAIKAFIRKAMYDVVVDEKDPTDAQKAQIQFVRELMKDMDTSFSAVISEASSILISGFSIHEKVFKYRDQTGKFKSKYNDGRIGWAKLPIRSQDSISRWWFDQYGRDITHVEQDLNQVAHNYLPEGFAKNFGKNLDGKVKIPYSKVLHFRHNSSRNNPEGNSPLKSCWIPWKYKIKIEEYQAMGISRDLGGMPVISLPAEYMSPNATDDKKAVYEYFKGVVRNISANEQSGITLPSDVDPITKTPLFKIELLTTSSSKMYDTDKIISGYENKILMTYLADVLKLGQDASGSFSLSDSKTNLLAVGIQALLEELLEPFNNDLIPQTFKLNGMGDVTDIPRIIVKELEETDLEVLGKFIQQVASVGAMELDEVLSDYLRDMAGAPKVDRTKPLKEAMLTQSGSKSGEGMKTAGKGTAKTVAGGDAATANASK